jgi:6-phosphogluconolactonase/glucosamine-6-phosphate isomerase/deaminase
MEIIRTNTPTQDAGKRLAQELKRHQHVPVLLLLSGGSALSLLPYCDTGHIDHHVTISVLDERYTAASEHQNFSQLAATQFSTDARQHGAQMIDPEINMKESLHSTAEKFEQRLRQWKGDHPEGVVIATMGIGPDGHTAGIMPHSTEIDSDGEAWVVGYTISPSVNQFTQRITVTYPFLREMVDTAIVYAIGAEKQQHITALENGDGDLQGMPASIMRAMRDVTLYTNA